MTHDEMIAVIQAHKEGKTIECRQRTHLETKGSWQIVPVPSWSFSSYEYRVKPEPAVIYAVLDGLTGGVNCASVSPNGLGDYPRVRRFVEDMDWDAKTP